MKRTLTCIICPRGCSLQAENTQAGLQITGHTCPKGEAYAISECTNPVRTVTATVRVANRENTMVSVKTVAPIAKDRVLDLVAALRQLTVNAPVAIGHTVMDALYGSAVVTTKGVD